MGHHLRTHAGGTLSAENAIWEIRKKSISTTTASRRWQCTLTKLFVLKHFFCLTLFLVAWVLLLLNNDNNKTWNCCDEVEWTCEQHGRMRIIERKKKNILTSLPFTELNMSKLFTSLSQPSKKTFRAAFFKSNCLAKSCVNSRSSQHNHRQSKQERNSIHNSANSSQGDSLGLPRVQCAQISDWW